MRTTTGNARIAEIQRQMADLRAQKNAAMKEVLHQAFAEFFDKYPDIESIEWDQYTPYFNDGEPCEFRVNEPNIFPVGMERESRWDEGLFQGYSDSRYVSDTEAKERYRHLSDNDALWDDYSAIVNLINDEDAMYDLFGNHVSVKATRKGIDVEDYSDHD